MSRDVGRTIYGTKKVAEKEVDEEVLRIRRKEHEKKIKLAKIVLFPSAAALFVFAILSIIFMGKLSPAIVLLSASHIIMSLIILIGSPAMKIYSVINATLALVAVIMTFALAGRVSVLPLIFGIFEILVDIALAVAMFYFSFIAYYSQNKHKD